VLIEKDYRLLVVSGEGEIILDLNLKGLDFNKPLASSDFTDSIEEAIKKTEEEYRELKYKEKDGQGEGT